jgi:hypothetical protein
MILNLFNFWEDSIKFKDQTFVCLLKHNQEWGNGGPNPDVDHKIRLNPLQLKNDKNAPHPRQST